MLNFKQYLQEAKIDFAPWHDVKNINWEQFQKNKIIANKDGTFSSTENFVSTISAFGLNATQFPVQLKTVKSIGINGKITSLWGFPFLVKNQAYFGPNQDLKTIDHIKTTIKGGLTIDLTNLESIEPNCITCNVLIIKDIGKIKLKEIIQLINIERQIQLSRRYLFKHKAILSLCKLPHNVEVVFSIAEVDDLPNEFINEISKVRELFKQHRNNIMDFQEALMDNNLEEYARL